MFDREPPWTGSRRSRKGDHAETRPGWRILRPPLPRTPDGPFFTATGRLSSNPVIENAAAIMSLPFSREEILQHWQPLNWEAFDPLDETSQRYAHYYGIDFDARLPERRR